MRSFIYILFSSSGYLGLFFYVSHQEQPEPCDCHVPLEYCQYKLDSTNKYITKYFIVGKK